MDRAQVEASASGLGLGLGGGPGLAFLHNAVGDKRKKEEEARRRKKKLKQKRAKEKKKKKKNKGKSKSKSKGKGKDSKGGTRGTSRVAVLEGGERDDQIEAGTGSDAAATEATEAKRKRRERRRRRREERRIREAALPSMEVALAGYKERIWLFANDFAPYTDFADPELFDASTVGQWLGEVGLANRRLGRLQPAFNHMQEALVYLGFEPVPNGWAARLGTKLRTTLGVKGKRHGDKEVLMAARMYEGIAGICLKTGQIHHIELVNKLAYSCTRANAAFLTSPEYAKLQAHHAMGALSRGRHDAAEAHLNQAKRLAEEGSDSITHGFVFYASGTYHAGQGLWESAEADFGKAFELFAPVGDTSRCGEVMIESAYVKLCTGNLMEALSMFREVCDMALRRQDQYLSLVCMHGYGLVHALMGSMREVDRALVQCEELLGPGCKHVIVESLRAYVAASKGDRVTAMRSVHFAVDHYATTDQVWFSVGLFLHLVGDVLFSTLECYNLVLSPREQNDMLKCGRLVIKSVRKMARVFGMMIPLLLLAKARWYLLHDRESKAEEAIDSGLQSEEYVKFPYAEGLLLLHSTRLKCLPDEERRARAIEGRRTLSAMSIVLMTLPSKPVDPSEGGEGNEAEAGGGVEARGSRPGGGGRGQEEDSSDSCWDSDDSEDDSSDDSDSDRDAAKT